MQTKVTVRRRGYFVSKLEMSDVRFQAHELALAAGVVGGGVGMAIASGVMFTMLGDAEVAFVVGGPGIFILGLGALLLFVRLMSLRAWRDGLTEAEASFPGVVCPRSDMTVEGFAEALEPHFADQAARIGDAFKDSDAD